MNLIVPRVNHIIYNDNFDHKLNVIANTLPIV